MLLPLNKHLLRIVSFTILVALCTLDCGGCGEDVDGTYQWPIEDGVDQAEDANACIPGPSLDLSKLSQPCRVSLPCLDEECEQRCQQGDCQNPQPPVCIAGDTYRCVEDDFYNPDSRENLGTFEKVADGCCGVRSADIVAEVEVLEVPTVRESTRLTRGHKFCFDPEQADLSLKIQVTASNRGNLTVRMGCSFAWHALPHRYYDLHDLQYTYSDAKVSARISFDGQDTVELAPGQSIETFIDTWQTPSFVCPVIAFANCHVVGDTEEGGSLEELAPYQELCSRIDSANRRGDTELLPESTCTSSKNIDYVKIRPRIIP